MKIHETPIEGLSVAESGIMQDERGFFSRLYCGNELSGLIGNRKIVQINQSRTVTVGTVRGMHYQIPPFAEMKLVRCIRGKVWDVAVDLRKGSSTRLKWYGIELSPVNRKMMIIPEGFAHGFQVLEPETELLYLHTEFYKPGAEGGVSPNDPLLAINWSLPVAQLSPRDAGHSFISSDFNI